MFIDRVTLEISAGNGGNGLVSWRREKYIPKGGPWGGNGGPGGSVFIEADVQIPSLDPYRHKRIIRAESGGSGGPNNRQGKKGKDLVLKVPCGTLIKDADTGDIIADLTHDKERFELCRGGKGGLGNFFFRTPTNRAPNYATPGKKGSIRKVEFELKLIADVGLVGFPNAGKSTLMSSLAHIRVKTAPYPFTTLKPNIGFITLEDNSRIYLADIPGIIEGAHENRGLGIEFLRHIERTKLLIILLDASGIDGRTPFADYQVLQNELSSYNEDLSKRPALIVLNKCDTDESVENIRDFVKEFSKAYPDREEKFLVISAVTGEGLEALVYEIREIIKKEI
ncbi:GTPase ObgE [Criblamydia sequanensis]|uniref:GTPase Obg n=1 Tax=Candidatus Criblamydia sequanensis CRIB-18 TaxID=1437425 RepID=A0A090D018_9BACT|nr:GTPase ObgE [Criblamydia sequanensis]CDR34792.1 GTPase ObgE [Criblamydia sequanensis CRIB-18]